MSRKGKALAAVMAGLMAASLAAPAYAATVRYDLNGPAGVVHEHTEDGDVAVEGIGVDFDGLGKLTGWNTKPDGTGEAYKTGDKVTADATLYAQYDDGTFAPAAGLNTTGGKTYYYADGSVMTGLLRVGDAESNVLMYFDADDGGAAAVSKLVEADGEKYYAGADGVLVSNALQGCAGKTYYFGSDGAAQKGVVEVAVDSGSALMYFGEDGARVEDGWVEDDGKSYLARNGELARATLADDAGKTYAFGEDGAQLTGHVEVGGKWYVCDGEAAGDARAGWIEKGCRVVASADGSEGYAGDDGALLSGLQELDGATYWFNDEGIAEEGWHATGLAGERAWCNSVGQTGLVVGWSATKPTPGTDTGNDKDQGKSDEAGDASDGADQGKTDAGKSDPGGKSDDDEGGAADKTDADGTPGNDSVDKTGDGETSGISDKTGRNDEDKSTDADGNKGSSTGSSGASSAGSTVPAASSSSTGTAATGSDLPQTGVPAASLVLVLGGATAAAVAGGRLARRGRWDDGAAEEESED